MPNRNGFTLIELLIVLMLIGILAAIAIPRFMQASAHAEAKAVLTETYEAQTIFKLEHGVYSDSFFDLGINLPAETTCDYRIVLTDDGYYTEAKSACGVHLVMFQDSTIADFTNQ